MIRAMGARYSRSCVPLRGLIDRLDICERTTRGCTERDRRLLEDWVFRAKPAHISPAQVETIRIPPSRRGRRGRLAPRLEARLATGDDPLLAPLRVSWHPGYVNGKLEARLSDLVTLGDPRDPGRLRQRWVRRRYPERCRIVVGEPAPISDLRERWRRAGGVDAAQTTGLAEFVVRQAVLACERAERRLRGARYKVPRFGRRAGGARRAR